MPFALTPGEPAGIGPDICLSLINTDYADNCIIFADIDLLKSRAQLLGLNIHFLDVSSAQRYPQHKLAPNTLRVHHIACQDKCVASQLNVKNANYVLKTLNVAADACITHRCDALVTGPVHKGIINHAGIAFTGQTEWLAQFTQSPKTVMLFSYPKENLLVALATTHLPLKEVPKSITKPLLNAVLTVIFQDLAKWFGIERPSINVCGLNPHAGEMGYLGSEEIEIISPVIQDWQQKGYLILGPLPADTAFLPDKLAKTHLTLAMYHDQGLPVIKNLGFGKVVNVTLGLPFIRTSVDHGTALDLAGTGQALPEGLLSAISLAQTIVKRRTAHHAH